MLLKKITLNNIRSYKNQEVEFPEGSTLLSGDIGSGKTSILLGIEFALFGLQPGQKGTSLLKNGESYGGVAIEFEIDDDKIVIERNLKRGKGITQDYCAITINGSKQEIAVTELKDKILDLLNYPKEFAKKQNLLYKFTVYTPQEEMKQIILQDPETRINTLRHVFGIDKYKRVLENLSILTSKLREEKKVKQALTENLEEDKQIILEKESELETKYYNLSSVEKELFLKSEKRKNVQDEREAILKRVEEKNKLQTEVEKTKIMIVNKKEMISGNEKFRERALSELSELAELKFDESRIALINKGIESLKLKKRELNEQNLDVSSKISSLSLKNQEADILRGKLRNLEICPTCLQDVEAVYRTNVLNKLDSEIKHNAKQIEDLTIEKKKISKELDKIEEEISSHEKELHDLQILKVRMEEINQKQKRLREIENSNTMLEKDVTLLQNQIETLKKTVFDLGRFDRLFEEKEKEFQTASKEERMAEIKVAELKKEIEVFSRQIDELKLRVSKTEELKKQLDYITILENWVSKEFSSVVSFIEKNVMVKLKQDFSKLFHEWFSMLVSETFQATLDDDFTPIIEQQDYEIDYAHLSGGERTAVALAYRLSLNQVINSLLSKIKTRDFVILDEPTDGFSDQQLDKMREVLDQLNVKQLIIVSHEQKIESFVENVIRFKKEDGISKRV